MSFVLNTALKNADNEIANSSNNIYDIEDLQNMKQAKELLRNGKNAIDEILIEKYKNNSLILFAGSDDEHKKRMKRNKAIIHGSAVTAAGAAAALAQVPAGDEAVLTTITLGMTGALCANYENASLAAFAPIASQIFGKVAGEAALKYALKWIPVAGNAANAAITFSLHETTGWALVAALEKFDNDGGGDGDTIDYNDIDKYISDSINYKKGR